MGASSRRRAGIWLFAVPVALNELAYVLYHFLKHERGGFFPTEPTFIHRIMCATSALLFVATIVLEIRISRGRGLTRSFIVGAGAITALVAGLGLYATLEAGLHPREAPWWVAVRTPMWLGSSESHFELHPLIAYGTSRLVFATWVIGVLAEGSPRKRAAFLVVCWAIAVTTIKLALGLGHLTDFG